VAPGAAIPAGRLAEALDSKSASLRREAQFAKNAESWKK